MTCASCIAKLFTHTAKPNAPHPVIGRLVEPDMLQQMGAQGPADQD